MSKALCHIIIFFLLIQISGIIASDKDVLLELKSFLLSTNRVNQGRYALWDKTEKNLCNWHGVTCNSFNQVTGLYLSDSIIAGKIYTNFSKLTYLTHLDLSNNTIKGSIIEGWKKGDRRKRGGQMSAMEKSSTNLGIPDRNVRFGI